MARAKSTDNGNGNARLEDALASLIQNQASFLARMSDIDARFADTQRENAQRFARIEALLLEHNRILEALPEAIREKMGFRPT